MLSYINGNLTVVQLSLKDETGDMKKMFTLYTRKINDKVIH